MAIITAICVRVSRGSKTPTSRNTIVAHNSEPPYFTTKAGSPSGKPYQRKESPLTITPSARAARISDVRSSATGLSGCAPCIARSIDSLPAMLKTANQPTKATTRGEAMSQTTTYAGSAGGARNASKSTIETSTIRAISWRLIPFLVLAYFFSYLDRVNLGFAALTMNAELKFTPLIFSWGAGIFFIGYFIFEVPSNLALEKFGASRWIARIMVTWGIISALMALVSGVTSFYVLRFLLGVAEAGF
ncbi:Major Facilitator Superfamily protein, partial [Bradyrhizobium sp. Rc2d]